MWRSSLELKQTRTGNKDLPGLLECVIKHLCDKHLINFIAHIRLQLFDVEYHSRNSLFINDLVVGGQVTYSREKLGGL